MIIDKLSNQVNDLHTSYDNILLLSDFNLTPEELKDFCDTHDLHWPYFDKPKAAFYEVKNSSLFSTGISDFHALATSIMKLTYTKGKPKIKFYRDYKNFDNNLFKVDLENSLRNLTDLTYTSFEKVFMRTLDCHVPIKKEDFTSQWKFFYE